MIFYYAVGGGLGHLTRGRRVLEILSLEKQAAFVTASPYARDVRVTGGIPVIEVPPHLEHAPLEHCTWLRDLIRERAPERLIADAFPAGIQGELSDLPIAMDHVARILRLDEYRRVTENLPRFETTWMVEELAPNHEALLRAQSERVSARSDGIVLAHRSLRTGGGSPRAHRLCRESARPRPARSCR
jgi:predicted glycosyltransferase